MLSVLFYLTTFMIVFIMQLYASRHENRRIKKTIILLSFFVLLLLVGLRYNVGTDYSGHINMYNNYSQYSFSELIGMRGDLGSKIIVGVIAPFFGSPLVVFWIYGLLALIPLYLINKKNNFKNLAYSTLIYNLSILPVSLNLIRQGAAISFILLSFSTMSGSYTKKATLLSLLWFFLAIIIHTSALLLLPYLFVFIYIKRKKKILKTKNIYLITAVIVGLLFTTLKDIFVDIGFLDYNYMLNLKDNASLTLSTIIMDIVVYVPIVFSLYISNKDRNSIDREEKNVIKMAMSLSLSGVVFDIVGNSFNYLSRISYYFLAFYVMLNPISMQKMSDKNLSLIMRFVSIILLVLLFVIRFYIQGRHEIMPYNTWLFNGGI